MKNKLLPIQLLLFFYILLFPILSRAQVKIPLDRISLFIFSASDKKSELISKEPNNIIIDTQEELIKKGARIEDLLLIRKFYPNHKDIYKLLYELNPTVKSFYSLNYGQKIILPYIKHSKRGLDKNNFVIIHLDDNLKTGFSNNIKLLLNNVNSVDSTALQTKFASKNDYSSFYNLVIKLNQIQVSINDGPSIISYENLIILHQLSSFLLNMSDNRLMTKDDLARMKEAEISAQSLASTFIEKKASGTIPDTFKALVKLSVKSNSKDINIYGYRLYYCAPGLEGVRTFEVPEISSNMTAISCFISEGTWKFWASKKGSNSPDTDLILTSVRTYKNNVVTLTLKR